MDVPKPVDTTEQVFTPYGQEPTPAAPTHPGAFAPMNAAQGDERYATPGWSWGAFMASTMFLLGIRKYAYLWIYLVGLIPFVGPFAILAFMLFLGAKGREMAMRSPAFSNRDQYVGFMKAIDHGGKIMFFLFVFLIILVAVSLSFAAAYIW